MDSWASGGKAKKERISVSSVPDSATFSSSVGSPATLGAPPALQETLRSMRGLASRQEAEVAALEASYQKLRELVATLAQDVRSESISKFHAVCNELGLQTPKDSLSSLQGEQSCSSALRGLH